MRAAAAATGDPDLVLPTLRALLGEPSLLVAEVAELLADLTAPDDESLEASVTSDTDRLLRTGHFVRAGPVSDLIWIGEAIRRRLAWGHIPGDPSRAAPARDGREQNARDLRK
ncbi:hypothetical protein [Actinoplanes couchii]|uniref:hypothetical protein n=1 Tax=Actinoplanes couchii TaxID=403638 RepID=UPI0019413C81|nr:hypothetical protein [Actinoplanes couchii]MDR6321622.1 hypothetical protein [Actinoplanes couchii]